MDAAVQPVADSGLGGGAPTDQTEEFDRLDALGEALARKRSESIQAREASGIEAQWIEDEEHYQGIDDHNRNEHNAAWRTKPPGQVQTQAKAATRSTVFVNITQPYVNAAAARIADMLLPSDDRNFALLPTPIPDLMDLSKGVIPPQIKQAAAQAVDQQGTQDMIAKAQEQAKFKVEESKRKADKAQSRIEDWMIECQYHAELRQIIEDCARIGTGVLKGPVPQKCRKVAMKDGGIVIEQKIQPGSKRIDPWNFYPDGACGENIHNGSYTWERDYLTSKQLLALKGTPGYIDAQIDKCIEEGPMRAVAEFKREPDAIQNDKEKSKRFEVWYYHGTVDKEDLESAGCECDEKTEPHIPALVTVVNNHVIRAAMNPLDSGDFPYDVMPWQRKSGMPWGNGVSRQGRTAQRIVNAGARNMMDNGGLSAGVQIVLKQNAIIPADGEWSLTGRKIWYLGPDSDMDDVRKAMAFFEIPSRQKELMEIVQFGLKMMEDATGLPMLLQGQQGKAPDTVGGMTLLNNNASAVLRRLARLFDDCITEPHVRRYYTWLLQYGEDDEKGDFSIDARGSSALVERDIQSQELPQMFQIAMNPVSGWDPKKVANEIAKSRKFDPKQFEYDDEEWKKVVENLSQKQDPSIAIAQLRAQTDEKLMQIEQQWQAQENQKDRELQVAIAVLDEQLASASLTSTERQTFEKIKAQLADSAMKLSTQKELSAASLAVGVHKHHVAAAKPPTEPAGRAAKGKAFQQ
jgi:hypothetical protein